MRCAKTEVVVVVVVVVMIEESFGEEIALWWGRSIDQGGVVGQSKEQAAMVLTCAS